MALDFERQISASRNCDMLMYTKAKSCQVSNSKFLFNFIISCSITKQNLVINISLEHKSQAKPPIEITLANNVCKWKSNAAEITESRATINYRKPFIYKMMEKAECSLQIKIRATSNQNANEQPTNPQKIR